MKINNMLLRLIVSVVAMTSAAQAATLSEVLATNPNFSKLAGAVNVAGLESAVANLKDATVFAPSNRAFDFLSVGQTDALFANPAKLKKLLLNHIIPQALTEQQLISGKFVKSLAGYSLQGLKLESGGKMVSSKIATDCDGNGKLTMPEIVGSVEITQPDVRLDGNVIVHVLDQVSREPVLGSSDDVGFPIGQPQFVGFSCGLLN